MLPPSVSHRCPPPTGTNLKRSRIRIWGSRPAAPKWLLWELRAETGLSQWERTWNCAHNSSMQVSSNPLTSSSPVHPPTLVHSGKHFSCRTTEPLEACESEMMSPTTHTVIIRGVLGEGFYPYSHTPVTSSDDWGDCLVLGTQKVALGSPSSKPSRKSAALSFRTTLPRHSVGWANDSTCPDCHATDHTAAPLFSCPTHSSAWPRGYL